VKLFALPEWSVLSLLFSLLLPYPDDLIVLLPQEVWRDKIFWLEKEPLSYNQTFTFFLASGLVVVLVGTGRGTHESVFLSPTKEAQ
jgi:hypothetical protein